ncbi:MAG TPA: fumarylacetoacetate hydrolase family protein [Galbitalea sp.]
MLDTPRLASLPVAGSNDRFPVRRVYCVGRNYADHAVEMGADPMREPPFFFSKPTDAVFAVSEGVGGIIAPSEVPYPPQTRDLQFEIELVVAIGRTAESVSAAEALDAVWGYSVGVDLTRRDLQNVAKESRRPWDLSKGFDASGPCTQVVPAGSLGHPSVGAIWLSVNGDMRQRGDLADQIWSVGEVISHLSMSVRLLPGDLIFTGTPAGVGPISPGDHVVGEVDGVGRLEFTVV